MREGMRGAAGTLVRRRMLRRRRSARTGAHGGRTRRGGRAAGRLAAAALALAMAGAGCQLVQPAEDASSETADGPWARPGSGEDLYGMYCASCHGLGAQGDGPVAAGLEDAPPDLTRIAARRGGTFPENEILRIVLGTDPLVAHGTRDMPVWGRRFAAGQPPGPATASQSRGRAMLIVDYLKSIQQPPLP